MPGQDRRKERMQAMDDYVGDLKHGLQNTDTISQDVQAAAILVLADEVIALRDEVKGLVEHLEAKYEDECERRRIDSER